MNWQATMTWQVAQQRAKLNKKIRAFFDKRSVVEVETPIVSQGTITDVHLDGFKTKYEFLVSGDVELYLQTSPEFAMKRLLASGYKDMYQICKAFRDEPYGRHHNPEFTILEWYRLGYDHFELMKEVEQLLIYTLDCQPATYISYQDVFSENVGIDPLVTCVNELKNYLTSNDMLDDWLIEVEDVDTLLQFIFAEVIEKNIGKEAPCFVYGFPSSQASLAKICIKDERVSERFECYFKGFELANGFHELTDDKIQYGRFDDDNYKRKRLGLLSRPIDTRFIAALNSGIPECSGVALGVDRLMMLLSDIENISDVLTFTIENA